MQKITIICGHYGSGKTNFALNLALQTAKTQQSVALVDLDIINPYFRSSEYTWQLEQAGIQVVTPQYANTTLDAPALSAGISAIIEKTDGHTIIDVGGDDAGAAALGRYIKQLQTAPYELLYVVNKYRNLIAQPQAAVAILREIETASRLQATGIVNNSHLAHLTTAKVVLDALPYAQEVSALTGLPVVATVIPQALEQTLHAQVPHPFVAERLVTLPWG